MAAVSASDDGEPSVPTQIDNVDTQAALRRGHHFEQVAIGGFAKAHLGKHYGNVYNIAGAQIRLVCEQHELCRPG